MPQLHASQILVIIAMVILMTAISVHIYSLILTEKKRKKYNRTGLIMIAISIITFQIANYVMYKEDNITCFANERLYK